MLSPAGIPAGSFSTSASGSAAEALRRPSLTGLENGLSTRLVPEPGLLYLKWKIQLEENTTSHSPEHVGWRFRRGRFIKLAGIRQPFPYKIRGRVARQNEADGAPDAAAWVRSTAVVLSLR